MRFSIKDFFSKCDQICSFLRKNTLFYRTPPMTASGCLRSKDDHYSDSYEYLLIKSGSPTMAVKQLPELRILASKILSLWKKQFITLNFQLIICRFILVIHQNMETKSLKFLWDTYRAHCLKLWKRKRHYKIKKKNLKNVNCARNNLPFLSHYSLLLL